VRIKEGLVQTVQSFFKSELTYTEVNLSTDGSDNSAAISIKSENGALMVLRENYKTIMENIEDKIAKEQDRLSLWESRQKTYFANLETLLKQYDSLQEQLDSQLAQLDNE